MKRRWSLVEVDLLRSMYPECHTDDVAAWMGRTVKQVYMAAHTHHVRKSAEYLASDCAARIQRGKRDPRMAVGQFKPGLVPWNRGLHGVNGYSEARFKPGNKPQTWLPVGTERITKDGIVQRKVSDTGHKAADWVGVHELVWSEANGTVPAGRIVVFKPGTRTTDVAAITLGKLECITRAENMRRNSVHTNYPPEVARLHQLRGALNRQINKRTRALEMQ